MKTKQASNISGRTAIETDRRLHVLKGDSVTRLAILLLSASLCCLAADAFSGTWKLDRAKCTSSLNYLPPADLVTTVDAAADGIEITEDFTGLKTGKKGHTARKLKFDGKDYPIAGSSRKEATDSASRVDVRSIDFRPQERR